MVSKKASIVKYENSEFDNLIQEHTYIWQYTIKLYPNINWFLYSK